MEKPRDQRAEARYDLRRLRYDKVKVMDTANDDSVSSAELLV